MGREGVRQTREGERREGGREEERDQMDEEGRGAEGGRGKVGRRQVHVRVYYCMKCPSLPPLTQSSTPHPPPRSTISSSLFRPHLQFCMSSSLSFNSLSLSHLPSSSLIHLLLHTLLPFPPSSTSSSTSPPPSSISSSTPLHPLSPSSISSS